VITRQFSYLERVRDFVRKLDVPAQGAGSRLYVYPVKHSTADDLAGLLETLFDSEFGKEEDIEDEEDLTGPIVAADTPASGTGDDAGSEETAAANIRIVPVPDSNSLLIFATPSQFASIELALEELDTPPLQVLMEVTIMDVQLTGDLAYGIQWFLEHGDSSSGGSAIIGDALAFPQTFSYAGVRDGGDVRAILGLLSADGKVEVLSSPSVLVRNNHSASIRIARRHDHRQLGHLPRYRRAARDRAVDHVERHGQRPVDAGCHRRRRDRRRHRAAHLSQP
jgi:general secretion pathway protein D